MSDSESRIGVTFTDIVYHDAEAERTPIHKVLTTPGDLSIGVSGLVSSSRRRPL